MTETLKERYFMIDFNELFQAILYPIIVYILLVSLSRVMGKKLLGQLTFFDFVTGITLGTIGGAFVTTEVRGYYVLVSAVMFAVLVFITGIITLKNVTARKLIEGEPVIVMQNGKIYEDNMKKVRYNQDDLMMQLREKDVFNMDEVEFAILEPHGKLSVLKKSQNQNVTLKDLNIPSYYKGISTEIIRDGRIQESNLKDNSLTHEWLYNKLSDQGIKNIEEVFLATLSSHGKLYIDLHNDNPPFVQKVEDDDSIIK
jgi:uncharacterized membrane protein YcaP (DUF421 family)